MANHVSRNISALERNSRKHRSEYTFEASWLREGDCSSLRILLTQTFYPALGEARGATVSGTGLFLEADCGKSGWLCIETFVKEGVFSAFSEVSGLESSRLDCVSSLEMSSVEAC